MKKTRNETYAKLSEKNAQVFIDLLDGWTERLTWASLIDAFEQRTGQRFTRQALDRHDVIKNAFQVRKRQLRDKYSVPTEFVSPELQVALDRCARLAAEIERIEAQNQAFYEQFVRWLYNANLKGVKFDELDAAMPTVDRQSTRERK